MWYHVAVAYDLSAGTADFYVNGSQQGTQQSGGETVIDDNSSLLTIGRASETSGDYFDGKIDDVRIWNDIRTSTEISDNYKTELVGNEAGLVAYWKLNNSLLDETTNDNDLSNPNSASFSTDIPPVANTLVCSVGSFALTGVAVILGRGRTLILSAGSFVLSGVILKFHSWTKRTKPSTSWTDRTEPSTSYSTRTKPITTWSKR